MELSYMDSLKFKK